MADDRTPSPDALLLLDAVAGAEAYRLAQEIAQPVLIRLRRAMAADVKVPRVEVDRAERLAAELSEAEARALRLRRLVRAR